MSASSHFSSFFLLVIQKKVAVKMIPFIILVEDKAHQIPSRPREVFPKDDSQRDSHTGEENTDDTAQMCLSKTRDSTNGGDLYTQKCFT